MAVKFHRSVPRRDRTPVITYREYTRVEKLRMIMERKKEELATVQTLAEERRVV